MRTASRHVLICAICLCVTVNLVGQERTPVIEFEAGAGLLVPVADVPCCLDAQVNVWSHRTWGIGVGIVHSIGTDEYRAPRIAAGQPGRFVLGARNFRYVRITGLYRSTIGDLDIEFGLGTFLWASSQAIFREPNGRTTTETTIRFPSGIAVHALLGTSIKGPVGLKGGVLCDVNDDGYFLQPVVFATLGF